MLIVLLRIVSVACGVATVLWTLRSAIQTFVLPRGVSDRTARVVFLTVRAVFDIRALRALTYKERDRIMALYAPIALVTLTVTWLGLVIAGYTLIYWGIDVGSLGASFIVSGSSIFTLGFASVDTVPYSAVVFSQAGTGLLLAALLVAYLPTIYGAWSRREKAVATLEVRAGSPPSAWELIMRYHRIQGLQASDELWPAWEDWFLDIEESHTSLSSIIFFRSPQADRSWVNAAGVILDAAALFSSSVDVPRNPRRELCLRAGYIALRRIAVLFKIPVNANPKPSDPISVTRGEFDEVWRSLLEAGVPMKPDRDAAWKSFSGWRVNYDEVLLSLASITMAAYAPWISDRSTRLRPPSLVLWAARLTGGRNREG